MSDTTSSPIASPIAAQAVRLAMGAAWAGEMNSAARRVAAGRCFFSFIMNRLFEEDAAADEVAADAQGVQGHVLQQDEGAGEAGAGGTVGIDLHAGAGGG